MKKSWFTPVTIGHLGVVSTDSSKGIMSDNSNNCFLE